MPAEHPPPGQTLPQRPQFAESVASVASQPSTSSALQSAKPAAQLERPHVMSMQSRLARATGGHDWPQPPQLSGSKRGSTHETPPSQPSRGSAHEGPHCPSEQTAVVLQGRPHPPQCALSVEIETHSPKQSVCPTAQLSAQPPFTQRSPGAHIIPQPPQLKTSASVFTHEGPQGVVPCGQAWPQAPPRHRWPGAHGIPQPPQWAGSKRGSTQPGPHISSGGAQPPGGTQVAFAQPAERQSAFRRQAAPNGHGAHGPPQSRSLSKPLASPSSQLGAEHAPPAQTPLSQSPPARQARPASQPRHEAPPQSRSVSPGETRPSRQLPGAHERFTHSALWQSPEVTQPRVSSQGPHEGPPQSTSLSSPFRTASLQVGVGWVVQPAINTTLSRSRM